MSTDFKLFHYYGFWVHDDQWLCSLWGGVYKSATPLAVSGESSNHQTLCTSGLSVNIFVTSCYLVVLWEAAQGIIVCGAVAAGLQSRKPLVPMIIETVTSWQLIWEPASPLHQSLVWTLSLTPTIWKQVREANGCCGRPALPPRTLSTRFCQVTRQCSSKLHIFQPTVANMLRYE